MMNSSIGAFYTEEEVQLLREEFVNRINYMEIELEQLHEDCKIVNNGITAILISNRIRDLESDVGTYKVKVGLIDNGYRGVTSSGIIVRATEE